MQELVQNLEKRRLIAASVICIFALLAFIVDSTFTITPLNYFEGKYNQHFIMALLIYKLIELPLLYLFLLKRSLNLYSLNKDNDKYVTQLKKRSKILYFLIPQGNTIFGIIAYKLSGDIYCFFLFSCIALIALYSVNPKIINTNSNH
ncbi:hypothetical protein JHD48_00140 [Sulfurimonas sp. SAG-AH-194-I05]|nr:hypothetical protein [Sulfurimonas sp. SAG-AH-194-I05]MDF1874134.1 hypothetical protein [Sulfurimonas sp. SAG-AH-194-I05]